jgi:hypothetical protein
MNSKRIASLMCFGAASLIAITATAQDNMLTCTHPETGKNYSSKIEIPNHQCYYKNWESASTIAERRLEAMAKEEVKRQARQKRAAAELARRPGVTIGMTENQARASSWGHPQHINRTTTARGTSEQWVYGGRNYLYFDNGVLVSIHN